MELDLPKVNFHLIRRKYEALKAGKDNVNYIQESVEYRKSKRELNEYLKTKYDYKNKTVIDPTHMRADTFEKIKAENNPNHIIKFTSMIQEQLKTNKLKVGHEEVLRAHVRNWWMLNQKQRRTVLGLISARRSRDAKEEFIKELGQLAQRIAYEKNQKNSLAIDL